MQKRGMSPLIATVLLITLTVILASIVLIFARGVLQGSIEKSGDVSKLHCATDIRFSIDKSSVNLNTISLTITNSGGSIGGFAFRVSGDKDAVDTSIIAEGVEEGKTKEVRFVYNDNAVGNVKQVVVFPRISIGNGQAFETCEAQSQTYNFN